MILVTGATGNVGRQVVAQLRTEGAEVRALSRHSGDFRGDLGIPDSLETALDGVSAVFLVWPLHTAEAMPAVLDLMGKHAERVVLLGSGGVRDFTFEQQQQALVQSGLRWTFIRPSTFAANALWWAPQIRSGDSVCGAYGQVAMPMLHERDIAAVGVRALLDDGHDGASYNLTGPEILTQASQVRLIGEALGRPVRWEEVDRAAARTRMLADDFPESFVDVLLDAYARMSTISPAPVTSTVEQVTGRPARTFLEWAHDHAAEFRPA
jgi:uncharacterized protein YbjT (DUF2867 family)